jgi:hypothetical protein
MLRIGRAAVFLLTALSLLIGPVQPTAAAAKETLMDQEFGAPNPKAPPELSQFAFLIGKWRCDAKSNQKTRMADLQSVMARPLYPRRLCY